MKIKSLVAFILSIALFVILCVASASAQTVGTPINIPAGFNWIYIVLFAVGMIVHYVIKVFHTLGSKEILKNLLNNFFGWFFNKWHWTLLAGGATAIMAVASAYELNIQFTSINALGIVISIAAGYIGDSAFNSGTIK